MEQNYSLKQMIMYKIDRSLAIIGMILIGGFAVFGKVDAETSKILTAIVTGLGVYSGTRGGNK